MQNAFQPGDVVRAACDAGFTTATFLDGLSAVERLTDADWAEDGIGSDSVPQLRSRKH